MEIQIHHSLDERVKLAAFAAGLRPGVFVGQIVDTELTKREKAAALAERRGAVRSGEIASDEEIHGEPYR